MKKLKPYQPHFSLREKFNKIIPDLATLKSKIGQKVKIYEPPGTTESSAIVTIVGFEIMPNGKEGIILDLKGTQYGPIPYIYTDGTMKRFYESQF